MARGRAPTVKDVAEHAGVSPGVVSRVVNANGSVSERTRKRVLASIKALDYRPHSAARELRTRTTNTIGLVLADVANPFFAHLAEHVVRHSAEFGLGVLLTTTQEDPAMELRSIELLMQKRVRGVIAAPGTGNAAAWRHMRDLGIDLTFVDRVIDRIPGIDVVGMDNESAAHAATTALLERGHRRIALVSGPSTTSTGRERIDGYRRALGEHDIAENPALVAELAFQRSGVENAVRAMAGLDEPPTALVVGNTAVSAHVVRYLQECGVRLPEDLSVVVFHDAEWAKLMTPQITVVRHQLDALARNAVEMLHSRMNSDEPLRRREIRLDSELVIRSSVAAPRKRRALLET
ncbi:LacI family DNA-binding transcriptional regulator [Saccharopolyspora oryzae]|uniref:LacI family DNA-binding transcriptional regulator n=1 Tax=Saccharopolyspora oryzae TaxID=2997343 RepID=A0ABT4V8H8_9PSEU|nr:LacI family DNA-binding transcriptional regulator [Saccharopolyspora oryzae]MDA3630259.1 LacI family DNA-binding transcriptional regulator [Saccharopolyspora oryzae]